MAVNSILYIFLCHASDLMNAKTFWHWPTDLVSNPTTLVASCAALRKIFKFSKS